MSFRSHQNVHGWTAREEPSVCETRYDLDYASTLSAQKSILKNNALGTRCYPDGYLIKMFRF